MPAATGQLAHRRRVPTDRGQRWIDLPLPQRGHADGYRDYPATGRALEHGVTTGLGVDTTAGTGTDLFTEMRVALAAERSRTNAAAVAQDESVADVQLDQRDMLRVATLDAAKAWHLDSAIGRLVSDSNTRLTTQTAANASA
jgi:predicted amidohydrolase YtcJ